MISEVILSPVAKRKLEQLFIYLENEFSEKTKLKFVASLDKAVQRIKKYPESYPQSAKMKSVRKCTIKPYTEMFYRIQKDRIEILTLFDSRQDPLKSPY